MNHLGEDYISALVMGVFNVSIPARNVMKDLHFLREVRLCGRMRCGADPPTSLGGQGNLRIRWKGKDESRRSGGGKLLARRKRLPWRGSKGMGMALCAVVH